MKTGTLVTAEGNKIVTLWSRSPASSEYGEWRAELDPGDVGLVVYSTGEGEEAVVGVRDTRGNFGWNWATMFTEL